MEAAAAAGVSVFWYALLSRRAFLWTYQDMPDAESSHLEWAYSAPHINWTNPFADSYLSKRAESPDPTASTLVLRLISHKGNLRFG